jgi:hypothetical protein
MGISHIFEVASGLSTFEWQFIINGLVVAVEA